MEIGGSRGTGDWRRLSPYYLKSALLPLLPFLSLSQPNRIIFICPFILGSYKPCQQVRSLLVETVVTYNRQNFRDKP